MLGCGEKPSGGMLEAPVAKTNTSSRVQASFSSKKTIEQI